jgi:branched-chain amino acid transport system substrate-binding protein
MRHMKAKSLKAVGMLVLGLLYTGLLIPAHCWSAEPYKIGGVFSVTGSQSFLGDPEKKSLEMVVDAINAQGGIDGHPLEAVVYDDEGDPTKAVLAANKLISKDNVLAVIGPSLTPTTLAIAPILEQAKVPLISCAAGIKITDPVKPYVFKTAQSDVLAVAAIYKYMQKQNIKKLGIITVANAFGESGKEQLQAQAPAFKMEIVQAESFDAKDTDMTAQLTKIRKAQPDAVICWGTNPGPAVVAKNMQQLGMTIPLYQSHGVASGKFIELAGDAAEGIILPTGKILVANLLPENDAHKPILLQYMKEFEDRYKTPVSGGFGGYAYDAMGILAKALKGTNGDREKVRDNIERLTGHLGVSGTFNFSPQDHNGLGEDAFVMVRIQKGAWALVQ